MNNAAAEKAYRNIKTILDSLSELVYVADIDTHELIFTNKAFRETFGEADSSLPCWQVIQGNQAGPCSFCTNSKLIDERGNPAGLYIWEIENTRNNRLYECRDRAITWPDGRIVRLEIALDVTEKKKSQALEQEARYYKQQAEELDRDLRSLELFLSMENNDFSAAEKKKRESNNSKTHMPDRWIFEEQIELFEDVLEKAVSRRIYKGEHNAAGLLKKIAGKIGQDDGHPRQLLDIYLESMKRYTKKKSPKQIALINEEGRLAVLEMMGYLAEYYRGRCV